MVFTYLALNVSQIHTIRPRFLWHFFCRIVCRIFVINYPIDYDYYTDLVWFYRPDQNGSWMKNLNFVKNFELCEWKLFSCMQKIKWMMKNRNWWMKKWNWRWEWELKKVNENVSCWILHQMDNHKLYHIPDQVNVVLCCVVSRCVPNSTMILGWERGRSLVSIVSKKCRHRFTRNLDILHHKPSSNCKYLFSWTFHHLRLKWDIETILELTKNVNQPDLDNAQNLWERELSFY